MTPLVIANTGGTMIDSYSITPALPDGLSFDTSTGEITGTPSELTDVALYTITGVNNAGSGNGTVYISIVDEAPCCLTYLHNPVIYTRETPIVDNTVTNIGGGTVEYYSISSIPAGLAFDTTTGVLSGTPSSFTSLQHIEIAAVNGGGYLIYIYIYIIL